MYDEAMSRFDRMNHAPEIIMPESVHAILSISGVVERDEILPDFVYRNAKDNAKYCTFDAGKLALITDVVRDALEEAKAAVPPDGWKIDELTYYGSVLEGMQAGIDAVRQAQAERGEAEALVVGRREG